MQVLKKQFNRNMALFDASSTLTYFRQQKKNGATAPILSTTKLTYEQSKQQLPRLTSSFSKHFSHKENLELFFWQLGKDQTKEWTPKTFTGPAKLFFVSSQKSSHFQPGDMIELISDEKITLSYEDMAYGFLALVTISF